MAKKPASVLGALNKSIRAAKAAGRIDPKAQAALIEAARKVAAVMDEPDWPIICKGKYDNVSPSALLKYCEKLGICPDLSKGGEPLGKGKVADLRDAARAMRGSG